MSGFELATQKYFEEIEDARGSSSAPDIFAGPARREGGLARWTSRLGMIVAAAVVFSVAALALPFYKAYRAGKPTNPIDWMLWFGGAKSGQTFEKFLRDSAETNQREWDDRYRESPMYQFEQQHPNWTFEAGQFNK